METNRLKLLLAHFSIFSYQKNGNKNEQQEKKKTNWNCKGTLNALNLLSQEKNV